MVGCKGCSPSLGYEAVRGKGVCAVRGIATVNYSTNIVRSGNEGCKGSVSYTHLHFLLPLFFFKKKNYFLYVYGLCCVIRIDRQIIKYIFASKRKIDYRLVDYKSKTYLGR